MTWFIIITTQIKALIINKKKKNSNCSKVLKCSLILSKYDNLFVFVNDLLVIYHPWNYLKYYKYLPKTKSNIISILETKELEYKSSNNWEIIF